MEKQFITIRCGKRCRRLLVHKAPKDPYHCPEYVQCQSTRLQALPAEILLNIVACFDTLLDIRALRCLRKVIQGTNLKYLGDVIDDLLNQQRSDFLNEKHLTPRWNNFINKNRYETDESLQNFVGKQLVSEAEDIEEDPWAFKESQLPNVEGNYFTNRPINRAPSSNMDRLMIHVGYARNLAEEAYARFVNNIEEVNGGEYIMSLEHIKDRMIGYGTVCERIVRNIPTPIPT